MKRILGTLTAVAGLLVLSGAACNQADRHTILDATFGEATQSYKDAMIENPTAGDQPPVEGLDPRSAEHVLENYDKNQSNQQHPRPSERRSNGIVIGEFE